jgi:hypothetical protein
MGSMGSNVLVHDRTKYEVINVDDCPRRLLGTMSA